MVAARRPHRRRAAALAALTAAVSLVAGTPATAAPAVPPAAPAADRVVVASGDGAGLHLLVADGADGYTWRTVATLSEPGLDADSWIGNVCVTGSGRRAVVVYAPRAFTNKAELFDRGGFTAVVDLGTGAVRKLPVTTSLAYFNPGCGAGEEAVLTQGGDTDLGRTRLLRLDAASGALGARIEVPGQLTSAVPTATGGIAAADSGGVVAVDAKGTRRVLAPATGVPFALAADADGGVTYLERTAPERAAARRVALADRSVRTLVTGPLTAVDVTSGRGGRVFVTGTGAAAAPSPAGSVSVLPVPAGSRVSAEGRLAVTGVVHADQPDPRAPVADPTAPRAVRIDTVAPGTGAARTVTALPAAGGTGTLAGPAGGSRPAGTSVTRTTAASPTDPSDSADRYCSVPRGDPRNQAMQPKPRQVEWAVNQAVRGVLTVSRPANWKNLGMPAYTPQGLFPRPGLTGGGFVPSQVMLGIAAQESNLWQAARFAVPGVTANPLIGNYYGLDIYNGTEADDWTIRWDKADCGYGVTQVTDGMRLAGREKPGETARPYQTQRAIALDFAVNVAAGLQILEAKWNQTRAAQLIVNNGDPARIENWFFAVWAYNSGFYPDAGNGQPWGVGWSNNPVNPKYPANRHPFLDGNTYGDAAHPQDWPYPEKVMGWAAWPLEALESPGTFVPGYRAAWWNSTAARTAIKPPLDLFCKQAVNQCQPGSSFLPNAPEVVGEPAGPCAHKNSAGQYDLKCYFHGTSVWKADCATSCGNETLRFDPGYAYQDDGTAYPPLCTLTGLPAGARIIDDVPDGTPSVRPNCGRPWTNAGTFTLTFKADATGKYPGKIDTHQIGGGFGSHFWFTHTRKAADLGGKLEVVGTWRATAAYTGTMEVFVAVPDHGAHTNYAKYTITTSTGVAGRVVRQPGTANRWVSLGTVQVNGIPQVRLSSVAPDGNGSQDIAFDAVAFVPR